jgi:hypothetical protein
MRIEVSWPEMSGHTRYAATAFDDQIGKEITVNFNHPDAHFDEATGKVRPADLLSGKARVVDAVVSPEGDDVRFTLEILDPDTAVQLAAYTAIGAFSNISIVEDE